MCITPYLDKREANNLFKKLERSSLIIALGVSNLENILLRMKLNTTLASQVMVERASTYFET